MMKIRKHRGGFLLMLAGILLAASAFVLICYNLWDNSRAAKEINSVLEDIADFQKDSTNTDRDTPIHVPDSVVPDYILNPNMEMPTVESGGYKYIGTLSIPALDLKLPVMDTWSYPQLKIAPCRYSGSAYLDNMIIAAHNYTSHFGRLKNLDIDDELSFTDVDGNVFNYAVDHIDTLLPTAIEEMQSGDWDLTLFTCTVGGQTRVTVRCYRTDN